MDIFSFNKRPFLFFGIAAVCGVCSTTGSSPLSAVILLCAVIISAVFSSTERKYIVFAVSISLVLAGYGFLAEKSYDKAYESYNEKDCTVTGNVVSVDSIKDEYTLLTIRPSGLLMKKIKVYIFDNEIRYIQGDGLSVKGKLSKPVGASNPGGYDARKIMYADGVAAILYANAQDTEYIPGFSIGKIFGHIRYDISETCIEILGTDNGRILAGMLIGDKTELDPVVKDNFRDSGLSHTMAVSGAHVAYLLAPMIFLFSKIGIERRKYYPWLLVFLFLFVLLTGFQPSVARAALTAGLLLLSGIIDRETEPMNSLAVSAVILILINPYAVYDAGFILSYSCVLAILIFYKPVAAFLGGGSVAKILGLTMAVQIGVVPVTAKLFYSIQIFSVIANTLIFPVRALLTVSGWLMYLLSKFLMPLANMAGGLVGLMTEATGDVADLFGGNIFSSVNVPFIPGWLVAVYFISVYLLLNVKCRKEIVLLTCTIIMTVYFIFYAIPVNTYVFYDAGQADCILIKTDKRRDILIDTGAYSLGNSLAYYCGDFIDSIFLSHAHEDHIGGLEDILDRFRVGKVFIPGGEDTQMTYVENLCEYYGIECIKLYAGSSMKADGYEILVLNPVDRGYLSLNDTSMVLKLVYKEASLLFCGDVEMTAEIDILSRGENIKADIFKVPHHGAENGAYSEFYKQVSADIAVISVGQNYFKHPSEEALKKLADSRVFRTDRDGAVIISYNKAGYRVKTIL